MENQDLIECLRLEVEEARHEASCWVELTEKRRVFAEAFKKIAKMLGMPEESP